MFQRDYWRLDDKELERLAHRNHIPPLSRAGEEGQHGYIDRDRIIDALLTRDNALRTKATTVLSILALLLSGASLLVSILKTAH